ASPHLDCGFTRFDEILRPWRRSDAAALMQCSNDCPCPGLPRCHSLQSGRTRTCKDFRLGASNRAIAASQQSAVRRHHPGGPIRQPPRSTRNMSNKIVKPLTLAIGAAFVGSMALTQVAKANSAFQLTPLVGGYTLAGAEGKCGEGKCGATKGM